MNQFRPMQVGIAVPLPNPWTIAMLRWAIIFCIVALIASAFGFWTLEGTAMKIARILFFVFLVLLVVSLVTGRRPTI